MPGRSHCPALSASRWGRWRADRYAVCAAPGTMSSCPIPGRLFALTTGLLPAWRPRGNTRTIGSNILRRSGRGSSSRRDRSAIVYSAKTWQKSSPASWRGYAMSPQQEGKLTRRANAERGLVGQREPEAGRVVERWAQRLHILCLQRRHMDRPVAVVTITVGDQCVEREVGRKRGTWVGALGRQVLRTEQAPAGSPRRCAHVARDRPGRS